MRQYFFKAYDPKIKQWLHDFRIHPFGIVSPAHSYDKNERWKYEIGKEQVEGIILVQGIVKIEQGRPWPEWICEGDYDGGGNMVDYCEKCAGYQFFQIDILSKDIIHCQNCEGNFMFQDHISDFKPIGNYHSLLATEK